MSDRPLPRDWRAKVDALKDALAKQVRDNPGSTLRVVPKGIHAPAFRRTVREIRSLEDEVGLRRCQKCEQAVIEGDHPDSQLKGVCAQCFHHLDAFPPAA